MMLIFVLSAVPGNEYPQVTYRHADKIVHLMLYLPLGLLLARSAASMKAGSLLASITFGLLYAATDEWHQVYVPNRSASFADWATDAVGVVLGTVLWYKVRVKARTPPAKQRQVEQK